MKNIPAKNPGDEWSSDDVNKLQRQELLNAVTTSGQTPVTGDQQQLIKAIVGLNFKIGDTLVNTGETPASHGIAGITWTKQTQYEGHLFLGSKATGDWAVADGAIAGTITDTNDHILTVAELATHDHTIEETIGLSPTSGTKAYIAGLEATVTIDITNPRGGNEGHSHKTSNFLRAGFVVWKRTT